MPAPTPTGPLLIAVRVPRSVVVVGARVFKARAWNPGPNPRAELVQNNPVEEGLDTNAARFTRKPRH